MSGVRTTLSGNVVNFFAYEVDDAGALVEAANDNCCPHCGGVLEAGDKASDCSGAWPLYPFPKGWEASC